MTIRTIFLNDNSKNGLYFSLSSEASRKSTKERKEATLTCETVVDQLTTKDPCDFSDKATRHFWLNVERLLKQKAGYAECSTFFFQFFVASPGASDDKKISVTKANLDTHFSRLHAHSGRHAKGLGMSAGFLCALALTSVGLSILPDVGILGTYAGLTLFAITLVLTVSAMIAHSQKSVIKTPEEKKKMRSTVAGAMGVLPSTEKQVATL